MNQTPRTEPTGLTRLALGLSEPRGFGDQSLIAPDPRAVRLLGGIPAPEALPVADIARVSGDLWTDPDAAAAALQYSGSVGFEGLRAWIAAREGVDPARVVITNGGMHGLSLVVQTMVERDALVALDDPVFPLFLRLLELSTRRTLPVRVLDDGLDVEALGDELAAGRRVAAVYTVPDFHNPTQVSLSAAKRRALVELAEHHGFVVIADDPYRELRFAGDALGADAFHASDRVVHVNTFTKTLGPGWRLGWLVLPRWLVEPVVRLRNRQDSHSSTVVQTLVERLVTTDGSWFDRVVARATALYRERAGVLVQELSRQLPGAFTVSAPEGGLFLWPRLVDDAVDPAQLYARAVQEGVVYQQGAFFAAAEGTAAAREASRHLRFAYGDRSPEELGEAVRRLAVAHRSLTAG